MDEKIKIIFTILSSPAVILKNMVFTFNNTISYGGYPVLNISFTCFKSLAFKKEGDMLFLRM
jgi:hypothetical protein